MNNAQRIHAANTALAQHTLAVGNSSYKVLVCSAFVELQKENSAVSELARTALRSAVAEHSALETAQDKALHEELTELDVSDEMFTKLMFWFETNIAQEKDNVLKRRIDGFAAQAHTHSSASLYAVTQALEGFGN